ncbi:fungal-specific transcription factor domain-containing protein [Xylariaceae sp. FL0255]|nr:fungal-specific transcription factor domain-containing protein [Xylariaceae sp. FL0255]
MDAPVTDVPHAKRSKISVACQWCKNHKRRCDGKRPACGNCDKRDDLRLHCTYGRGLITNSHGNADKHLRKSDSLPSVVCSSLPQPFWGSFSSPLKPHQENKPQEHSSGIIPVFLASEINAALNARLGITEGGRLSANLFPLANAPLFGSSDDLFAQENRPRESSNVLPPRRQADELLNIYWQKIHPREPVLDKEAFSRSYAALFVGESLDVDEHVFASILNIIFAFSTQLQVFLSYEQREQTSSTYFRRAWALLSPQTVIWESNFSPEVVQCLLLMSRYLHCTKNMHQAWMTVGCAVRIAQSLGLHMLHVSSPSSPEAASTKRREQLWQACVLFDRQASYLLGRVPLMSPSVSSVSGVQVSIDATQCSPEEVTSVYWTKTMELLELNSHILQSQTSMRNTVAEKYGLLHPDQQQGQIDTALRLNNHLSKWQTNLPDYLRWDKVKNDVASFGRAQYMQAVMLQVRFLHIRTTLFRPLLWYLSLSQPTGSAGKPMSRDLEYRIVRECAALCVENAQEIIGLIYEHHKPDDANGGIMPWWNSVFYVYIVATVLAAAMLKADLYTTAAAMAWDQVILVLTAHEHLSPWVRQSRSAFQTLCRKILGTHHPGGATDQGLAIDMGSAQANMTDVFQDVSFDPQAGILGTDDLNWLVNFDFAPQGP